MPKDDPHAPQQPNQPPPSESHPPHFDRRMGVFIGVLAVLTLFTALGVWMRPAPEAVQRVAYLGPTAGPYNIWMTNPPEQVTFYDTGIFDFSVSADGRLIAYAAPVGADHLTELFTYDLRTGETVQITQCAAADAYCTTPVWRPDNRFIAYQRIALNTELGIGPSAPRLWMLDLAETPAQTFPLFSDTQMLGTEPQWAKNGESLVFYDSNTASVMVFHVNEPDPDRQLQALPAGNGSVGALSPDGRTLVFPELLPHSNTVPSRAVLRVADLNTGDVRALTDESIYTDDSSAAWHPDGERVAITRIYLDDNQYTRGYQVYLVTVATGEITPLIVDADYQHNTLSWSADGAHLLMYRFKVTGADVTTTPEIWTYTLETDTLTRVAPDGFGPRWVEQYPNRSK